MDNWKAYVCTASRHQAFTYLQKKKVERMAAVQLRSQQTTTTYPDFGAETELQKLIAAAVHQLPAQQQLVYKLTREQGLRRHEIAARLNIAPDTVKGTLQKALRSIKQYLHQHLMS
jgi:RNA polymerase sigma factor (sigma-70 family)